MIYGSTISKYNSAFSSDNVPADLSNEIRNISNGKYKELIINCRALYEAGNKIAYRKSKAHLPAVTFSGLFTGAHKKENLCKYSQFIVLDIDAIEKNELTQIKQQLFNDLHVLSIWISPSGYGLKILIKVSNSDKEHKLCFDVLSHYFKHNYLVEIDKSGSDLCRLCFVSYDEEILIKRHAIEFNYQQFLNLLNIELNIKAKEKDKTTQQETLKEFIHTEVLSDKKLFKATENKNFYKNRDIVIKIIKYLKKNKLSITNNYSNWYRVALAIANSFTYDLGEKYYLQLCRLDGDLHDEYKTKYLLEYCYRNRRSGAIKFSTIIYLAKQKGFILK